ncbi:MAG: hypothetical protein K2X55_24415 [Burkholderiaceae bacterium]|nr:hypothetical protein [Burkholderiaceae bacterium]
MTLSHPDPLPLPFIIATGYVPPVIQPEVTARIALEFEGDEALSQARFADALVSYRAARSTSWRIRAKMGWCCFQLEQWETGGRFLGEAARRGEALPLLALIRCFAGMNGRAGELDEEIDQLVRALLDLPDPASEFYELADVHMIDPVLRLQTLRLGWERFPAEVTLRRRYTRALWAAGGPEAEVFALVHAAVASVEAAPEDLWQGYEIAVSFGRHQEGLTLVRRLADASSPPDRLALALVEEDVHILAGDLDAAAAGLRTLIASLNLDHDHEREVVLHAAKALVQVGVAQGDESTIAGAAQALVTAFCHYGVMSVVDQPSPLDPDLVHFTVGAESVAYRVSADLAQLQGAILRAVTDADVRALLKVLYASQDGPYATLSAEQASELTLAAGRESDSPFIQRHVGWAAMEAGHFEEAGRAFWRFEVARAAEAPATWSTYDDDSIFDEAPYSDELVVDQFAKGMVDAFRARSRGQEDWPVDQLYEIAGTYLRAPLLQHMLYTRFYAMMDAIVDVHRAAGTEPTPTVWFDYGLACQYVGRTDQALAGYQACLAQDRQHAAARANQLMLVPFEARKRIIIDREIDEFVDVDPPTSIAELTLQEALYLLALYRACSGAEQDLVLQPFGMSEHPFAPTPELLQPLFRLLRTGLVRISRETPASAFTVEQAPARVTAYVLQDVSWELPAATMQLVREIEQACLTGGWPEAWRNQAPMVARELAAHECLAYLRYCAGDRTLPMPTGEKTMLMIENALTSYSVAQTYAFCWQGVAASADFKQRKNVSAVHAGNAIVGNCQRRIDLARAKKWDVANYTRPREVRRTHLSFALFDTFLGFGERAFTLPLAQLFEFAGADVQLAHTT